MDALLSNVPTNIPTVAHVIQQALTPVFLLGGVGSILNVLTGRLARAVDRFRAINALSEADTQEYQTELLTLQARVGLIRRAISFCTICALFVCVAIVTLFLGAELELNLSRSISVLFIAAILALTVGLLFFLREINLAANSVNTS